MEKYDIAIIGGGPGGYPAAIRAAQLGASVALIEKESLGGTCLNWGCIPTKTLIAASSFYARAAHDLLPGLKIAGAAFDYKELIANKNRVVGKLRNGVAQLLKANGVHFLPAAASFAARDRLLLKGNGGESVIAAKHIVVATGSVSTIPAFLPKSEKVVDSRAFLDMESLPASILILGAGVIGCELGCMAAQLGVKVTIVEILEDIMTMLDKDLRAEVRRHMENKLNMKILTGKPLEKISCKDGMVKGQCGDNHLEAELLLCAAGRSPVTAGLELEKCGLKTNAKGFIETDGDCRTKSPNIFAIGDVNGKYQLAHAATAQGIAAVEAALGRRQHGRSQVIPSCIFTAPEVGAVGMSEQDAARTNRPVITGKFPFAALGKALASGETTGFVKWIADRQTGQLLGAGAVGAHATELIAEAALAVQSELTGEELGKTVHAHPTMAEAWMEAAHAIAGHCIHMPPKRKAEL
jgi:dihydrolipoamide dehydrogenase